MNIVQMQDSLKDLSDQQLLQTMQTDSAPHYLVLAEMQRRKKARQETAQRQPQGTVADEIMSGIAAVPAPNMQFAEGGIVPFQEGGLTRNTEQERVIQMLLSEAGMPDTPENRRMVLRQGMRNYFPEQYADPNRQTGLTPEELAAEPPKERRGILDFFIPSAGASEIEPAPVEAPRIPRGQRPTKLDEALANRPSFEERYPFISSVKETLSPEGFERLGAELKEKITATPGQARETLQAVGEKLPEFKENVDIAGTGFKSLLGDYIGRVTGISPFQEYATSFGRGFSGPEEKPAPAVYPPNNEMLAREAEAASAAAETPAAPTDSTGITRVSRADDSATLTAPTAPAGPQVGTEQLADMGATELAQTREVAKERPDFFSPEALLALGIGMIAGGSKPGSTFGSAVGEGGLAMLQQIQSRRKAESEREKEEMLEAGRMERARMEQAGLTRRAGINAELYARQFAALNRQRAADYQKAFIEPLQDPIKRLGKISEQVDLLRKTDAGRKMSEKELQQQARATIDAELEQRLKYLEQLLLGAEGDPYSAPPMPGQTSPGPYNFQMIQ